MLTLDLHAGQIQGFFDIPTDNLFASPVMVRDIKQRFDLDKVMVVSPDVGGVVRARGLAKRINAPLAIVDKRRERPGESEVANVIGEVDGRICILVDDIVDSGGTLLNAADALLEQGASAVYGYITHGVLSGGAVARINESRSQGTGDHRFNSTDRRGESLAQYPRALDRAPDRRSDQPHRRRRIGLEPVLRLTHAGGSISPLIPAKAGIHSRATGSPHARGRADRRFPPSQLVAETTVDCHTHWIVRRGQITS